MRTYGLKTKIYCEGTLAEILDSLAVERILIFLTPDSISAYNENIQGLFRNHRVKFLYVEEGEGGFSPEKPEDTVFNLFQFRPDCILTIGGYSLFNYTKIIHHYYIHASRALERENRPLRIHIPVHTAGGLEITDRAYIINRKEQTLTRLRDEDLAPDWLILSKDLYDGKQSKEVERVAFLALATSVDAYLSTDSNDFSTLYSNRSLKVINRHILQVKDSPSALLHLQMAGVMAGIGTNLSNVGLSWVFGLHLQLAFGGPLTDYFSIVFPEILDFQIKNPLIHSAYGKLAKKLNFHYGDPLLNAQAFLENIKSLRATLGLPKKLCEIGIDYGTFVQELDRLSRDIYLQQNWASYPISLSEEDIRAILLNIS